MGGSSSRHRGLGAKIGAALGLGVTGRLAKADRLISQARARAASDPRGAISLYTRAVDLVAGLPGLEREKGLRLGPALIGRGELQEQLQDQEGAVQSYLRARRAHLALPPSALTCLARAFASKRDFQWEATTVYLDLVRALAGRQPTAGAQEALAFLERHCVADPSKPNSAAAALALCKQLMAADPNLGWPQYRAGLVHFSRREYQEALAYLQRASDLKCDRPEMAFQLCFAKGMVSLKSNQVEEAMLAFRAAAAASPERPEGHFMLGKLLVERARRAGAEDAASAQMLSEAAARLADAVRLGPQHAESAYWLGEARLAMGDAAQAAAAFRQAAALEGEKAEYQAKLALALRAAGASAEALAAARRAVALEASSVPFHRLLAELSVEAGDCEEAARALRVVVAASPGEVEARVSLGAALRALGRHAEAVEVLAEVQEQSPAAAFHLARCYAQLDEPARAIPILERLAAQSPAEWETWYYLGLAYAHVERFGGAVEAFGKALAAGGPPARIALQRGHAYCKLGRLEEAAGDYQGVLSSSPEDVEAIYAAACVSLSRGEQEEALRLLTRLTSLDGSHVSAHLLSGSLWEAKGDLGAALAQYRRAAELAPSDPRVHRRLGVLRCRQGDYAGGLASFEQSGLLGDDSDELLYYLGLAAAHSGYLNVAVARWTGLADRHPDDVGLRREIAKLHFLLGNERAVAGRMEEAGREWDLCLPANPDPSLKEEMAELHLQSALAELGSNHSCQVTQARVHLERALALSPHRATIRYYLAACRLVAGEWDGYLAEAGPVLPELEPRLQAYAKYHMGMAWLAKNDPAQAEPLLKEAAAEAGRQALSLDIGLALAMAQAKAGDWREAIGTLQRGLPAATAPPEGASR